jgi:hypothetical protein
VLYIERKQLEMPAGEGGAGKEPGRERTGSTSANYDDLLPRMIRSTLVLRRVQDLALEDVLHQNGKI